jgi:coenzyme F420-reducing hydrogenase delta subunit
MGVGPPGRTGRDQLAAARELIELRKPGPAEVLIVACSQGAGAVTETETFDGAPVFRIGCAGAVHTSVIEYAVRSGAGGVLIVPCPPRDCWNREGPKWLEQRMYHDREAELRERVDRRRIRVVYAGAGERELVRAALGSYRAEVTALLPAGGEAEIDLVEECREPGREVVG